MENFDYKTIKTVDDAFKKQNLDRPKIEDLPLIVPERFKAALLAVYELFIVFEAINDEWAADFTNLNQYKYYPWFQWSSGSGFDFSGSAYVCDYTCTFVGSRLCTDSSEKALYIAEQFGPEYTKFFL